MSDISFWALVLNGLAATVFMVTRVAPWLAKRSAHQAGTEEAKARTEHEREATGRVLAEAQASITQRAWDDLVRANKDLRDLYEELLEKYEVLEGQRDALFDDLVSLHNVMQTARMDVPPLRSRRSLPPAMRAEFVKRTNGDSR